MIVTIGLGLLVSERAAFGQNLRQDYLVNVPRQYGPRDPWEVGIVMRNQIGWGGHFFNCDCEEHKRMSTYIRWEQQPTICCPHGHCWDIKQQIDEVRQRIRTGSCQQCEFQLCPRCGSSEPPIQSTCADGSCPSGGCPTCGAVGKSATTTDHAAQADASATKSEGWLGRLYLDR